MPSNGRTRKHTSPLALALLLVAGAALPACTGKSMERVDPAADDDLGGTLIDSADVIAATDQAVADLSPVLLASAQNDIVVAPATIKNESIQPFNTSLLTDRLIDGLVRATMPRVTYLAREHIDEVLREREAKREGVYSSKGQKMLLGADYLLTGRINSLTKSDSGDRADYFQLGFRLVDAEDGRIVWSKTFEFKKQGDAGVIYQ